MTSPIIPMNADSLPTVRLEMRPQTAPGKSSPTHGRGKLPARPGTAQEMIHPSEESIKRPKSTSRAKKAWSSAFQRINVMQTASGGLQIYGGRSSRLRKVQQVYQSPDFAYIKPKRIDVKQTDFAINQAKFWSNKFKQLLEIWENEKPRRTRLNDILPHANESRHHETSRRYNDFFKNYSSKYRFSKDKSGSPMHDEEVERKLNYVPIRHSEIAVIEYEREKRKRDINLVIQRSNTISKEIDSLTKLKKEVYEPDI